MPTKQTIRFGLKSLLLIVGCVALVLQFWIIPLIAMHSRFQEQQQVASKLVGSGAIVDWDKGSVSRVGFNPRPSPKAAVNDSQLKGVEKLSGLQDLHLALSDVGNETLERLKGLTSLEKLNLASTKITDDGLQHLKRLTNLRSLLLQGTAITDQGLPALEHLQNLEMLSLDECPVTFEALSKLQAALPNTRIVATHVPKWPPPANNDDD